MSCDIMIIPDHGVSHTRLNPWCLELPTESPHDRYWLCVDLQVRGPRQEEGTQLAWQSRQCGSGSQLSLPLQYCQSQVTGRCPGTLDVCFPHNILSPWRDISTMRGMEKSRQSWRGGDAFEGAGSLPWNLMTSDKWLTLAVFLLPSAHTTDFAVYIVFLELVIFILCTVMVIPHTSGLCFIPRYVWWPPGEFSAFDISAFYFDLAFAWLDFTGNFLKKGSWMLYSSYVHTEETMCLVWLRVTILCFHFIITVSVLPMAFWHLLCCEESEVIPMALLQLIWVFPNIFLCVDPWNVKK